MKSTKVKVVILLDRKEVKLVDKDKQIYDIGHGRKARLTCWSPEHDEDKVISRNFVYVEDKEGYVRMKNGGYLVIDE